MKESARGITYSKIKIWFNNIYVIVWRLCRRAVSEHVDYKVLFDTQYIWYISHGTRTSRWRGVEMMTVHLSSSSAEKYTEAPRRRQSRTAHWWGCSSWSNPTVSEPHARIKLKLENSGGIFLYIAFLLPSTTFLQSNLQKLCENRLIYYKIIKY